MTISAPHNKTSALSQQVTLTLTQYFETLDDQETTQLYQMVMTQVEEPLIRFVLEKTEQNQTKAALMLGINRNTLRKKMQTYGLL